MKETRPQGNMKWCDEKWRSAQWWQFLRCEDARVPAGGTKGIRMTAPTTSCAAARKRSCSQRGQFHHLNVTCSPDKELAWVVTTPSEVHDAKGVVTSVAYFTLKWPSPTMFYCSFARRKRTGEFERVPCNAWL